MSDIILTEKLWSIIIGINSYLDCSNLNYCVRDSDQIKNFLEDKKYHPNQDVHTMLLNDESEDKKKPTKANILKNLNIVIQQANSNDTILFFFAGHGLEINGEPTLLPSDYRIGISDSGIKIEDLKNLMNSSKASFKFLILDSCHSGAVEGREVKNFMGRVTLKAIDEIPKGFAILSACDINQISYEDNEYKHGVFTYYYLLGAKGDADQNNDNKVTLNEMNEYLYTKVKNRVFDIYQENQFTHFRCNMNGIFTISEFWKETRSEPKSGWLFNSLTLNQKSNYFNIQEYRVDGLSENITEKMNNFQSWILLGLRGVYGITKLKQEGDIISFPEGVVKNIFDQVSDKVEGETFHRITFNFNNENKNKVIEVLKRLDDFSGWDNFILESPYKFNIEKIDEICRKKDWEVIEPIDLREPQIWSFIPSGFIDSFSIRIRIFKENSSIFFKKLMGGDFDLNQFDDFDLDKLNELCKSFI